MHINKKLTPEINRLTNTVEIEVSNLKEFNDLISDVRDLNNQLQEKLKQLNNFKLNVTFSDPHSEA